MKYIIYIYTYYIEFQIHLQNKIIYFIKTDINANVYNLYKCNLM